MRMRSAAVIGIVAMGIGAGADRASAQESLASARQLYASAEYQGALTMLNGLLKANPATQDRQSIDLYRTFCLVALGVMDEASAAVDAMIKRDPLYHPNADEVPPRLRTLFRDARRRLLPGLIQQRYVSAKAAFDKNDYKAASEGFTQVLIGLSDPDIAQAAGEPPLADLKVLASGFNDLTIRSLTPAPAPPAPAVAAAAPPTSVETPPPLARSIEIYSKNSTNVTEPVVIRQALPAFPGRVATARTGVVEVVIDETGAVESAAMVLALDPAYNRLVLAAAKSWVYRPARRDGAPVKYRKRVEIALTPGSE
jgi:hypothetical protein